MPNTDELLKQTSRTLYLSAQLLPADVRAAFSAAYLLCRYADSIADTTLIPPGKRLAWIEQFPALVKQPSEQQINDLVAEIVPADKSSAEEILLRNLPVCLEAFKKLDEFQQQATLEVLQSVCDGMKIDLQTFPDEKSGKVKSFVAPEELKNYCHLMGGAPGVFWSQLIDHAGVSQLHKNIFFPAGKDIGDALQIVNILRDLPRDLRMGRCYLPSDDLVEEGIIGSDLLHTKFTKQFEPIKRKWIKWGARKLLASAAKYISSIPKSKPKYRAAMAWPILWAADTLNKLERTQQLLDPTVRIKISRLRIYATMLVTPLFLISNTFFAWWLNYKLAAYKSTRSHKK